MKRTGGETRGLKTKWECDKLLICSFEAGSKGSHEINLIKIHTLFLTRTGSFEILRHGNFCIILFIQREIKKKTKNEETN